MTEHHQRFTSMSTNGQVKHVIKNSDLHDLIKMSLNKNNHNISNLDRYIYEALLKQMEQDLKEGKAIVIDGPEENCSKA